MHTFISINIEERKHLDRVLPFLKDQAPDYLFIQELHVQDLETLKKELSMEAVFTPMRGITLQPSSPQLDDRHGVAIFSREPIISHRALYYGSFFEDSPEKLAESSLEQTVHCPLLTAVCRFDNQEITLGCTHLTWVPDGTPTDAQRRNTQRLLANLQEHPEILLCGDFNAPRGYEVFDQIATIYTDNIPASITTTIDPTLHRAGPLQLVVDGAFTTPGYHVSNVSVHAGLSDHQAVHGEISLD